MQATQLQESNKVLLTIISKWIIHCDYHEPALAGCAVTVLLCDIRQHVKTCAFNPATSHTPVRAITTASLVRDVLQTSPSKMCGNVADRLMSTIPLSKTNEGRLEIKSTSRGRPQTASFVPGMGGCRKKRLSFAETNKLLQDIGLHPTAPSPGTALAIEADLALSFSHI